MKIDQLYNAPAHTMNGNKRIKKRLILYLSMIVLALTTASCLGVYAFGNKPGDRDVSPPPDAKPEVTPESNSGVTDVSGITPAPTDPEPVASEDEHTDASPDAAGTGSTPAVNYDPEHYRSALFIGDSRMEGFQLYAGPHEATYYAAQGLNVNTIYEKQIVGNGKNDKITAIDALQKARFNTIYIMLGTNELGWAYSNVFIERYGALIDDLKASQPDATIYVESILPVTKKESDDSDIYNMDNIREFNELIVQMTQDKQVRYLNVAECVTDEEGYLFADASTDGIHLNKEYCEKWFAYIEENRERQEND